MFADHDVVRNYHVSKLKKWPVMFLKFDPSYDSNIYISDAEYIGYSRKNKNLPIELWHNIA